MQRLDTVIANITTVTEFLADSKFTVCYFERTLNIHPPFVVSFAVLIIKRLCALETTDDFWLKIKILNRAFSLTWPASMLIYWNKRKHLHEKRAELSEDFLGTPTWSPFHGFGTPIWPL